MFNGETIEPMPLAAENLLQASFRYSEDTVISGLFGLVFTQLLNFLGFRWEG